jgi:Tfp pilus assembly protein PilF
LKKFGEAMEAYARQRAFYVAKVTTAIHGDPKSFSSRVLADAELNAQRSLFYAHTQRPKEALAAVDDALKEDPNMALGHEAKGFLAYSQGEYRLAEEEFARAIELKTTDYFPYYFLAETKLRSGLPSREGASDVTANLEKAIQMNPQFAPAYAALASVYSMNPETHDKAFADGRKAVELEPGNLSYATNYGYVLANAGKTAEAKELAMRIQKAAKTPMDRANAQQLLAVVVSHEVYDKRLAEMQSSMKTQASTPVITVTPKRADRPPTATDGGPPPPATAPTTEPPPAKGAHQGEEEFAVEGNIVSADCGSGPGKLVLASGKSTMTFSFADFAGLELVSTAKQDSGSAPACANWAGRHVRLYFYKVKEKGLTGDVNTVQFF